MREHGEAGVCLFVCVRVFQYSPNHHVIPHHVKMEGIATRKTEAISVSVDMATEASIVK